MIKMTMVNDGPLTLYLTIVIPYRDPVDAADTYTAGVDWVGSWHFSEFVICIQRRLD